VSVRVWAQAQVSELALVPARARAHRSHHRNPPERALRRHRASL
jgi:hypothetical protein